MSRPLGGPLLVDELVGNKMNRWVNRCLIWGGVRV